MTKNRIFTVFGSHFPEKTSLFDTRGYQAQTQNSKPPKKALRALCTSVLTPSGIALPSMGMARCKHLCAGCLSQDPQLHMHPVVALDISVSFLSF